MGPRVENDDSTHGGAEAGTVGEDSSPAADGPRVADPDAEPPRGAAVEPPIRATAGPDELARGELEVRREARDIAHKLNNALATIIGACRVMRLDEGLSEQALQDVGEIEQAGQRAKALTRSLSALGRGSAAGPSEPLAEAGGSPARADVAPGSDPAAEPEEEPVTILLVEDDAGAQRVIERMLQMSGYRVFCACSGEEALEICDALAEDIDLLLTDVTMPGMDGYTLYRTLRERRGALRVLLMSGYIDQATRDARNEEGVAFLAKPFLMDVLLDSVRASLAGSGS